MKTFEAFRLDETAGLDVKKVGMKGDQFAISINGHEYGYKAKEDSEKTLSDIATTFEKMLKYSAGRALQWLKKNTVLASGSKKNESEIFEKLGLSLNERELVDFESFVRRIEK